MGYRGGAESGYSLTARAGAADGLCVVGHRLPLVTR